MSKPMSTGLKTIIEDTLKEFCQEFVKHPYLCYTEHGLHALFYAQLYKKLQAKKLLYTDFNGQKVCVIQKEYPTAGDLGKSKRQNWDISIIKHPLEFSKDKKKVSNTYDFFKLTSAIEFGLNASVTHLDGDISRLCHHDANVDNRYIVHFYRVSETGKAFSRRDKSSASRQKKVNEEEIKKKLIDAKKSVTVYYAYCEVKGSRALRITKSKIEPI